jgi:hypothetical protein
LLPVFSFFFIPGSFLLLFFYCYLGGAPPPVACQEMGVALAGFLRTVAEDRGFHERIRQAGCVLSQNVAARLYRAAMEGDVSAQKSYLQMNPPPEWRDEGAADDAALLEGMTPHELAEQYRAAGLAVPPELEALARRGSGEVES